MVVAAISAAAVILVAAQRTLAQGISVGVPPTFTVSVAFGGSVALISEPRELATLTLVAPMSGPSAAVT